MIQTSGHNAGTEMHPYYAQVKLTNQLPALHFGLMHSEHSIVQIYLVLRFSVRKIQLEKESAGDLQCHILWI